MRIFYHLDTLKENVPVGPIRAVVTLLPDSRPKILGIGESFRIKAEFPDNPEYEQSSPYYTVRLYGPQYNQVLIDRDDSPYAALFKGVFEALMKHHRAALDAAREIIARNRRIELQTLGERDEEKEA